MTYIVLCTTLVTLLGYTLCYVCVRLYNMNYKEEFAAMVIGVIFIGVIMGFLYTILITWKELKEKNRLV